MSNVLAWFEYLFNGFWEWLDDMEAFAGLSVRDLFISFLIMAAILAFIFKKVAPSNE